MKNVLTIAGSDPSGGAGIQADIKTISAHNCYATSVITALTSQNTIGVKCVFNVPGNVFDSQLRTVLEDIHPDAIKIGMLGNEEIVEILCRILNELPARPPIVLDTIMISTSGHRLLTRNAIRMMCEGLFPLCSLITPNLPEAEYMLGENIQDMGKSAEALARHYGCNVLLKGGHSSGHVMTDYLCRKEGDIYTTISYEEQRIQSHNLHGTGCTLSSAIASNLALGKDLQTAVKDAKHYISKAIQAGSKFNIGHGNGPLWHFI